MHQRTRIRKAAKDALLLHTMAEDRVATSLRVPWKQTEPPALVVHTPGEAAEDHDTAPRELERTLQLMIEGVVVAAPSVEIDDAIDDFTEQVERAMHRDETLGGTARDALLVRTEIDIDAEAEQPVGRFRMMYLVTYYTQAPNAADQALDSFKTADVRYDLEGQQPANDQAHDVVSVPGA